MTEQLRLPLEKKRDVVTTSRFQKQTT